MGHQRQTYHRRYSSNHRNHRSLSNNKKQHQIISIKTGTLITRKKELKEPIFYDPQTQIAQEVNNINKSFPNCVLEKSEKQKIIHQQQCNLIDQHLHRQNNKDVDSDNIPFTPSASDNESDDDEYTKEQQIKFGATKDTKLDHIWQRTEEFSCLMKWETMYCRMMERKRLVSTITEES